MTREDRVKLFEEFLNKCHACENAMEFSKGKTLAECWDDVKHLGWLDLLIYNSLGVHCNRFIFVKFAEIVDPFLVSQIPVYRYGVELLKNRKEIEDEEEFIKTEVKLKQIRDYLKLWAKDVVSYLGEDNAAGWYLAAAKLIYDDKFKLQLLKDFFPIERIEKAIYGE